MIDGLIENKRLNLKEFREERLVLQSRPTRAWFSITGKCNLLCTHCPRSLVEDKYLSSEDMSQELFQKIEKELFPTLKQCRIGGNTLGEQLFTKNWNEYSERMTKYSFTPWLITNGQSLTSDRIKKLVENEFTIDISIDAATDEKYYEIRGARLVKLINNVREIYKERDRQKKTKCKIIFSITAFWENIYQLPKLVSLAAELEVDEITVTHFIPSVEAQRYQSLFYHQTTANEVFIEAKQLAEKLRVKISLPPLYPVRRINSIEELKIQDSKLKDRVNLNVSKDKFRSDKKCLHPWTSTSINEKGEVYPCCHSFLLMGDLKKSNFEEVWNNKRYQKLRKTVNCTNPMPDCQDCIVRGGTFTSVECDRGEYFLKTINFPTFLGTRTSYKKARQFLNSYRWGQWLWSKLRYFYKNIIEWHT